VRKKIASLACAGLMTALTAGPALAGEITGPPGGGGSPTPIENHVAASMCSFNGLNDFNQGQKERITQNYGTNIQLGISREEGGFPGTDCRGTPSSG